MRLLHIAHPGRQLYEQDWLARTAGSDLRTVVPSTSSLSSVAGSIPLPVRRSIAGRYLSSTASAARYIGLDDLVDHSDVDVILTIEVFSTTSYQGLQQARRVRCPLAVLVYELIDSHPVYRIPPFRKIAREVASMDGPFICVSKKAADHLHNQGIPDRKVQVISPGVDTELFQPPDASQGRQGIVFVGVLAQHKGIPELISAYEEMSHTQADLQLTVIGDGPLRKDVLDLARRKPAVSYLGRLPPAAVARELQQHAIFVLPASDMYKLRQRVWSEQLGFSALEAMAAGLAVVTTDCGALPEVVPPPNPIVQQHDPRAIAGAIQALLADRPFLQELQSLNREAAITHFSLDGQARRLYELLVNL